MKITEDNKFWIDTRLQPEEMDFLWKCISEENKKNYSSTLAGNISKSEQLKDEDNWFYKHSLKKLTEKMFYRDWDAYYKYVVDQEEPPPRFEMDKFWVNYQKQHEFNPIHKHGGLYSFVIFMKIPTHWKEQHALPFSANSNTPCASDFQFVWTEKDSEFTAVKTFLLSPEDEGRMLFFPATLQHMVYPFYECEEERVTISGNIGLYVPLKPTKDVVRLSDVYIDKENMLKVLEENVKTLKKELYNENTYKEVDSFLKKEGEKEGLN